MVQVDLNNISINIGAINGSEKLRAKKKKALRLPVSYLKRYMLRTDIENYNFACCFLWV